MNKRYSADQIRGLTISMKLIRNVKIILRDNIVEGAVLFSNKIESIILEDIDAYINVCKDNYRQLSVLDGKGCYLSPGFIDIHIHGTAGYDTMDESQQALSQIKKSLIKSGVTSFLATTMSMPIDVIKRALGSIRYEIDKENIGSDGARILGCHLEGPFLNKEYKGAQNLKNIVLPDIELVKDFTDIIKIVTIAPEIEAAEPLIRYLTDEGIITSAGHTGSSYEDILTARKWGLSHVTHLFNGMTKLHHRNPGIIGAVLTTDMSCELIADFIHIHPAVLKIVLQTKELDKIILITDQNRAGTLDEGEYDLGGQKVIVKDGSARLEDGSLAGSVLTLDQAVRNISQISDLNLNEIINMVTYNPACLVGMEDQIGSVKEGNRADFVILNSNLEVMNVYKDGQLQNLY